MWDGVTKATGMGDKVNKLAVPERDTLDVGWVVLVGVGGGPGLLVCCCLYDSKEHSKNTSSMLKSISSFEQLKSFI